jgi:type IV pilus assembly protein PilQ
MAGKDRATASNIGAPRRVTRWLGGTAATLALAWGALAQAQAPAVSLTAVEVQPQSGNTLQVRLRTSGPAPEPLAFTIDQPARLSIDLPEVGLALENRRVDVGAGGVDTIVAAEATGRTRIVFNLDSLVPYSAVAEGDSVLVTLGSAAGAAAGAQAAASAPAAAPAGGRMINGVDFRRAPDGTGRVVDRSSPTRRTPVSLQARKATADRRRLRRRRRCRPDLVKRYDVVDFATPVTFVDALRVNGSSRLVINATGDFEQLAYQSDNQYVVEVRRGTPMSARGTVPEEKKEYTGERLTLNFQDIDVRAVLQLLADTSGQNIVVSDSVQGSVTLRLQNVPWDQALDIVLRTKGLDDAQAGTT